MKKYVFETKIIISLYFVTKKVAPLSQKHIFFPLKAIFNECIIRAVQKKMSFFNKAFFPPETDFEYVP